MLIPKIFELFIIYDVIDIKGFLLLCSKNQDLRVSMYFCYLFSRVNLKTILNGMVKVIDVESLFFLTNILAIMIYILGDPLKIMLLFFALKVSIQR